MKKRTLTVWTVIAIVAGIACFAAIGALGSHKSNLAYLAELPLPSVDLSLIEDGVYTGKYELAPLAAKVEVTVKDHTIMEIKLLKHVQHRGAAAEAIPARVVEAQTLEVEVVSGATYSSKVILKAIENALVGGGK